MCSDHFSPWSERQGHSGFAWSWLGAALATHVAALRRGQRAGPALPPGHRRPGRPPRSPRCSPAGFWVALGYRRGRPTSTSPATGGRRKDVRNARLQECVEVIRALHAGEEVSHDGLVRSTGPGSGPSPTSRPPLIGAAVSAETAAWAAGWADGLVTVNQPLDALRRVLDAYREAGGRGPGRAPGAPVVRGGRRRRRCAIAHDQWRTNVFGPPVCWDIETVEHFDVAASTSTRRTCGTPVLVSSDPGAARRLDRRARRPRLRRRVPPPRRPGPAGVHRRLRRQGPPAAGRHRPVKITDTSDLWWKTAVVYCLDVETFLDWDGDGTGDLAGLVAAHRLPGRARRHLPLADADLPDPRPRRRLRHHRLLRRRPPARATTATSSSSSAPPATGACG